MSKLERLQKYLIALILLLVLVIAGAVLLLLRQNSTGATLEVPVASDDDELTEVKWYYPDHVVLNEPLTELPFQTPDGETTALSAHLGNDLTFAMYWGSWCSYCEEQIELLLPLADTLEQNGVKVLLIDKMDPQKESLDAAKAVIAEKNIPLDWIVDSDLSVYDALGLHIIPTTFLLDRDGNVRFCNAGVIESEAELNAMLDYARYGAAADTESFVENNLTTANGGVQMHVNADSAASPSGQDVLSESQGLIMEYASLTENDDLFRSAYGYVQKKLDVNGLMRWYGTENGQPAQVNALLDDLRVLRALSIQNDRTGEYEFAVKDRAKAIANGNFDEDGNLIDFYTFEDGSKAHRLTMCYADWQALDILAQNVPERAESIAAAQETVDGAYLGDDFPFYANYYDYETQSYDESSLNMAEAMLTLLHQAKAGRLPEASLRWLHTQLAGNGVWARYDIHGNVLSNGRYQSAAVYAIIGRIAVACGDEELLTQATARMESFRCLEKGSGLNGAFAETLSGAASFDQCMALVLYAETDAMDQP